MKKTEFNNKLTSASEVELYTLLEEQRKDLFTLRQRKALRQLDNIHAITDTKKNIARILTEIRARELKG